MHSRKKSNTTIYFFIILCLFLAMVPVIFSDNYLRQDDMKTGIWWGMSITDEGYLYYNTTMQLVRPICMLLFYIIDLISINMHYAVFVRLASIINICILGVLLFRWQLFFNRNRLLAATFAIAAFTLPGIQLSAATANYFLMLVAILLAFGGPFYWYKSFCTDDTKQKRKYLIIGSLLFFSSFLDYPISSMYAWVLLSICYLNSLVSHSPEGVRFKKFFYYASFLTLSLTGFYFFFIHIYHWVFQVDLTFGRLGVMHLSEILPRTMWVFDILVWHSQLWNFFPDQLRSFYPLFSILVLLCLALTKLKYSYNQSQSSIYYYLGVVAVLLFVFLMCYSPALAAPDDSISYTFRYTIATMPLLLYVVFWSIHVISSFTGKSLVKKASKLIANLFFLFAALLGIYYANIRIADGIVGPQDSDFRYIESQLNEKVVPLLRQHKLVALYMIDCDHGNNYVFEKGIPIALEYNMRLCAIPHHLIGAVSHSLMTLGYTSNYRKQNYTVTDDKVIILKDVPWGNLIVGSNDTFAMNLLDYPKKDMTLVTIDMRNAPHYKQYDLYKRIWSKLTSA